MVDDRHCFPVAPTPDITVRMQQFLCEFLKLWAKRAVIASPTDALLVGGKRHVACSVMFSSESIVG